MATQPLQTRRDYGIVDEKEAAGEITRDTFFRPDIYKTARIIKLDPPANIRNKIPKIKATDNDPDPIVWVKYFNPYGAGTWLVTEYDGHDEMFGLVHIQETELGYFSLNELKSLKHPMGFQQIERELHWTPKPLSEARRMEHMATSTKQIVAELEEMTKTAEDVMAEIDGLLKSANMYHYEDLMRDIKSLKKTLIQKVQRKGLYENFGQKEVRLLEDEYGRFIDHGPEGNAMRQALIEFMDWTETYSPKLASVLAEFEQGKIADAMFEDCHNNNECRSGTKIADLMNELTDDLNRSADWEEGKTLHNKPQEDPSEGSLTPGTDTKRAEEKTDDKESRFEEGKPADPKENMSEEDKAKWDKYHGKVDKLARERLTWNKESNVKPKTRVGVRVILQANPVSRMLYRDLPPNGTEGTVTTVAGPRGQMSYMPGPGGGLLYVEFDDGTFMGVSPNDLEYVANKIAASGLYGYTKQVQATCEGCISKLSKYAVKLAKTAYTEDADVVPFLATHAKRGNSLPAKILVAAMKDVGPQVPEEKEPEKKSEMVKIDEEPAKLEKEATARGLYGYKAKTANKGLAACTALRSEAGRLASELHSRKAALHEKLTGFLGSHSKEASNLYAQMLVEGYPEATMKFGSIPPATSVEEWLIWEE